jgi:hypothetical protein
MIISLLPSQKFGLTHKQIFFKTYRKIKKTLLPKVACSPALLKEKIFQEILGAREKEHTGFRCILNAGIYHKNIVHLAVR